MQNNPKFWINNFPLLDSLDNKYSRGVVYVIAGNIDEGGSVGAAKLAGHSALRAGAGIVKLLCNAKTLPVYASSCLSLMVQSIENVEQYLSLINQSKHDVILAGPGSGVNHKLKSMIIETLKTSTKMLIDADGLTIFADSSDLLFDNIKNDTVLTPHEGEFKKLFKLSDNRVDSAISAAKISKSVIVLKGHNTVIASPCGKYAVNENAPSFLATAGSGDVLAGIIAGLMAQKVEAFDAACMGVYMHSQAAQKIGRGMISEDLLLTIPKTLQDIEELANNYNNSGYKQ